MASPRLSCESLTATIGDLCVVADLDLCFKAGQFWGVLGANGAGKTTLLRHLAGLLEPERGSVALNNRPLHQWPRRPLARMLGMLQQQTSYVFDATVLQVALTGRHPHLGRFERERAADLKRARSALADMGLLRIEARSVTALSGGEARRLAFAALQVQDTPVQLLDEPTNHLDFRHQVRLMSLVGEQVYGQQRLALAALHDVNLAATYCSHVLLLHEQGRWQAGTASELLQEEELERLYQCPITAVETPHGTRFHPTFSESPD